MANDQTGNTEIPLITFLHQMCELLQIFVRGVTSNERQREGENKNGISFSARQLNKCFNNNNNNRSSQMGLLQLHSSVLERDVHRIAGLTATGDV